MNEASETPTQESRKGKPKTEFDSTGYPINRIVCKKTAKGGAEERNGDKGGQTTEGRKYAVQEDKQQKANDQTSLVPLLIPKVIVSREVEQLKLHQRRCRDI